MYESGGTSKKGAAAEKVVGPGGPTTSGGKRTAGWEKGSTKLAKAVNTSTHKLSNAILKFYLAPQNGKSCTYAY